MRPAPYEQIIKLLPSMKNLTTADKAALIAKLQSLSGLTDEEKANLIGLLDHQKKYGLVWENKTEEAEERLRDCLPVLREEKERAIVSEYSDAPNHILIEGDNLEALTALSYTHEGKVDVIYIDPPYNTGNNDFVYNDKFVDSEDDYRHSKWLSFMHKRLKIARRLLSERGVIFISIDDNEQANLKLLCDEVFGEKNSVAEFVWKKKQGGGNDSRYVVTEHEYILVYAKKLQDFIIGTDMLYKPSDSLYPFHDKNGDYGLVTLDKASIQFSKSLVYDIVGPDSSVYRPRVVNGKQSCWRWSQAKVKKQYEDLVFKNGKVYTKYYRPKGVTPRSLLVDIAYGRTESGRDDLAALFKKIPFDYPKPISLIKHFITLGSNKNSTILDFFAGSGTTMHAVMQLNAEAESKGKRQCILVTNNENNICEEVTYERNKRVIRGYTTPKGEEMEGLTANTLRYYKTDLISRDRTPRNMRALMDAATDLLCIKEDAYSERKMLGEMQLEPKRVRMFDSKNGQMLVIYEEQCAAEIAHALQSCSVGDRKIKTYIFSPGRYAFDDEFAYVQDKVELVALPAAIYDAYQRVLPKRKDKQLSYNEEGGEK